MDGVEGGNKLIEKYRKLSKIEKLSKFQKLSKSQKLVNSGKKLLKSGNLSNFNAKKNGPSFLTPNNKTAFNQLRLAFTKALILPNFDPECYIWIETDVSGYAISGVLSQLTFQTRSDGVVTKTDLG